MKQTLHTFIISVLTVGILNAQNFLNGSFEVTTAPMSCQYNLSNAAFNGMMSNATAYGAGNETDIMIVGCYVPSIPDGNRCIALAAPVSDEIALALDAPLVAGQSYTFTFYVYADVQFRARGDAQIGASTNGTSFGTLIYTAATVANTWVQYSVTFIAPNNTTHITMRNIPGDIHWNRLDAFRFEVLLPIHVQNFTGNLIDNVVQLKWETESELNNAYFVVERSLDGLEWQELGKVNGAGNSNIVHQYQMLDPNPIAGTNYYRLRQVDFDGNHNYSNTIAIDYLLANGNVVEVYPNPSSGVLNIRLTSTANLKSIKVVDAFGKEVFQTENQVSAIDLSHLAAGVYWVKIQLNDGTSHTKKIALTH